MRAASPITPKTLRITTDTQGPGVNVRIVQRQLEDAGVTFSHLLHEVHSELVLRHLENPDFSLARIAELLSYCMPSCRLDRSRPVQGRPVS